MGTGRDRRGSVRVRPASVPSVPCPAPHRSPPYPNPNPLTRTLIRTPTPAQPVEKVEDDCDRDFFMTPEEAKDYGIIDEVRVRVRRDIGEI